MNVKYLNIEMIYDLGFRWDGISYSAASAAGKNCGLRIVNYQMAKLFVLIVTHFIYCKF